MQTAVAEPGIDGRVIVRGEERRDSELLRGGQHAAAAAAAAADEDRVLGVLRLDHEALAIGPVEERQRLVLRDEPRGAAADHRFRGHADREAVLAIVRLLAGLADQVLPLLADAVHHRERPGGGAHKRPDVVVAAHDAFERDGLVDGHGPQLRRLRPERGAERLRFVAFDVALQVRGDG
jgi:hypothetical protein